MNVGDRLLRGWLFIAVFAAAAGAGGGYVTLHRPPVYEATTTVIVQPKNVVGKDAVDALYPLQNSGLIPTLADIASSDATMQIAARAIQLDADSYSGEARVLPESFGVSVAVRGPNAVSAAALDAAVVDAARDRFSTAYPAYAVAPLSLSPAKGQRVSIPTVTAVGVTGFVGALLAALLVLAAGLWRPRTKARPRAADVTVPRVYGRG